MRGLHLRAWQRFVSDVHAGLAAARIDLDFFGVDDLRHLFDAKYTAAMVVERAIRIGLQQQLASSPLERTPDPGQPSEDRGPQSPGQSRELSLGTGR